jgi:hypothetical protein
MRWAFPVRRLALVLVLNFLSPAHARAAGVSAGLVAGALGGQGDFGTIKGRLTWGGADVPPRRNLIEKGKAPKDPDVCAKGGAVPSRELEVDPKTKGVAHGFVYLVRPKGANADAVKELLAKRPKAELDQKNCEFIPYAQVIHQDQALVIKSSDPVNHNVRYSAFRNQPFNQILAPNGQLEVKLVAERLPMQVACDVHPWMKAWILVLDHPFFAVTGPDGSFQINGVPAGQQNVVVWQEKVGFVNPEKGRGTPVTIKAGETTDLGAVAINPSQVK